MARTIVIAFYLSCLLISCATLATGGFNKTTEKKPYYISPEGKQFHDKLEFVVDLHSDALLLNRNLVKKNIPGHLDFPRMREGNVAMQFFTIVTKTHLWRPGFEDNSEPLINSISALFIGDLQPVKTWFNILEKANHQIEKLHNFERADPFFHIIKSKGDLEVFLELRKQDKRHISGVLGIEGIHCIKDNIDNMDSLYEKGVRMVGITHFFDNQYGSSQSGKLKLGLTTKGIELVERMDSLGIIVDLAHASDSLIIDVLKHSSRPPLVSHVGTKSVQDSPRNLSDEILKKITKKGGLIGVLFFDVEDHNQASRALIIKHIIHLRELVGVDHIALGSDYDGFTTVPFDISGIGVVTDELMKVGFTESEIRAIMGENVKNFLLKHLK